MTPEQMWDNFIEHLNKVQPMKGDDAKHMNFLGSIAAYRKLYLEANKPTPSSDKYVELLKEWLAEGRRSESSAQSWLGSAKTDTRWWTNMTDDSPSRDEFFRRLNIASFY